MTLAQILDSLGAVTFEPSCVVADDPGEIVRHAAPLDERARTAIREQQIARMVRDHAAVTAREQAEVQRRRDRLRVVGGMR
jgi:hypothetical protein